jgi:hypothetical protein
MSDHSADEAAIRRIHPSATDAINRDDAKLGAGLLALDADYVDSLKHLSKRRSEIEHKFQELFAGPSRERHVTVTSRAIAS